MNGIDVKKLLVSNNVDLNGHKYFDNSTIYNLSDVPIILVDKNILKEKLCKKFGKLTSDYIIAKTYNDNDDKVDPREILKLVKFE
jgi:hypothetical protein